MKNKRIMKKEYIKPEMLVEEFISDIYMQSASGDDKMDFEEGDDDGRGANDRRGGWGDLWN